MSYDALIENNTRRIQILEEIAQAIYREWFVEFRYPDHEDEPLVDSDLGPIPRGWKSTSFADLGDYLNGFAFKPSHWGDSGLPIVKIKELKAGVTRDTPRCLGADVPPRYLVRDGDLLFSWSADLDAYIWSGGDAWLNQHLFLVTPREEVPKLFLFHALRDKMGEFRARSQGTTMKHIKRAALTEVHVAVPGGGLPRAFEALVAPLDSLRLNLVTANRNLRTTRDLLLPRLVSGDVDVSDLDIDVGDAAA